MSRIAQYLKEDLGYADITSEALIGDQVGIASILAKQECVLAGIEEATEVFHLLGLSVLPLAHDGKTVTKGTEVLRIEGKLKSILAGERLALNFLMRMSGIATTTSDILMACRKQNPAIRVAATRKTTPGFRFYEKKAVVLGGGDPHRYRLDDAVLIKDNHLAVVGSITEAIRLAKKASFTKKVEVEVESLAGAKEAAEAGADIIMLDNLSPEGSAACALAIRKIDPRILIEASGGITPESAPSYARAVDVISLGWLTHSVRSVDLSLEIALIKM